jgi:hypothetical protein
MIIINLPDTDDKTFTYVSKVTGATIGAAGAAKGSVDLAEAIACQAHSFSYVNNTNLNGIIWNLFHGSTFFN